MKEKKTSSTSKVDLLKPSKKASHTGDVDQPRVLVERKELQALQGERRTLFARIDEAAAEARALRGEVTVREETLAHSRVTAAQQQEVWARHDALRCEERDAARTQAAQAEDQARVAGEARAAAEADRARLREQLAVSEAESRRAQTEATRSTQQLIAAQAEMRKADETHKSSTIQLREELGRERERAASFEARARELEPEKELATREVAALSERLTAALSERRALELTIMQANEKCDIFRGERDKARERADAADARAEKLSAARAAAEKETQAHAAKIAALEAAVSAAHDAKLVAEDRLQREASSLKTHVEYAETRCREAERRRDALIHSLDGERSEAVRVKSALARAEEKIMEEQVRCAVAEEKWGPLMRQRDEAQRERARAARALSAMHAEKRELEWAVSDLGRRGTPGGVPLRAWEPALGVSSGSCGSGASLTAAAADARAVAAGMAATPYPPRASSSFRASPFGTHANGGVSTSPSASDGSAAAAVAAARAVSPMAGMAAAAAAAGAARRASSPERLRPASEAPPASSSADTAMAVEAAHRERVAEQMAVNDVLSFEARLEAARAGATEYPWASSSSSYMTPSFATSREAHAELDRRLELERAAASAANPSSSPWSVF